MSSSSNTPANPPNPTNPAEVARLYDVECRTYDQAGLGFYDALPNLFADKNVGPLQAHNNILDLGCGTGKLLIEARRVTDGIAIGVDISTGMVDVASQNVTRSGFAKGPRSITILKDNIVDLASTLQLVRARAPAGYHVIYAMNVLSHLSQDDRRRALALWRTLLAPNGHMVVHYRLEPHFPGHIEVGIYTADDRSDLWVGLDAGVATQAIKGEVASQFEQFMSTIPDLCIIGGTEPMALSPRRSADNHVVFQSAIEAELVAGSPYRSPLSPAQYKSLFLARMLEMNTMVVDWFHGRRVEAGQFQAGEKYTSNPIATSVIACIVKQ